MNILNLKRALPAILIPALSLASGPAFAAEPKAKAAKPPVLTCKTTTPEGLSYTVITPGKGEKPGPDARVVVDYQGRLKSDGSEFDQGEGAKLRVGGVIDGFAQGLQMMQPGAKYRLCIPSKLGYGEQGSGSIPANADLVFEVTLKSFSMPLIIPVAERTCETTTASGLGYTIIKAGSGALPTDADMALIDFKAFDAKSGVVSEERMWEKIPMNQATGIFVEALKLMPSGSTYRFCMPAKADAAAEPGAAEAPAEEPMINIIVDLIGVRPAPEPE